MSEDSWLRMGWLIVKTVTTKSNPCAIYGFRVVQSSEEEFPKGKLVMVRQDSPSTYHPTKGRYVHRDWVIGTLPEPPDGLLEVEF